METYTIRGIKYVENADDSCEPKAEITEGGIDQKFATVKVTSGRGCGLHSVVSFLVQRPAVQEIEKPKIPTHVTDQLQSLQNK